MVKEMHFTTEQETAIYARNQSILISAAAGSGKTAVLVERITMMLLQDNVSLDQLVVLTFTNAAATQMKERIRQRLQSILATVDESKQAFIKKQIMLLPVANISTFHAYCIKILRNYYQYIELAPGFKVVEENVLTLLKNEAMQQTLNTILEMQETDFEVLFDY